MERTFKLLKYTFFDTLRSKWAIIYMLFFLLVTYFLLFLSDNNTRSIISLMNIIIGIIPLVATVFSTMYFYNSKEFNELLLSQPIKRTEKFMGQYLGLAFSLALSFLVGFSVPFIFYAGFAEGDFSNFLTLLSSGLLLTFIFSALAFLVCMKFDDKIKGFGLNILIWLFLTVLYDGLILVLMMVFQEYPLEKAAITVSLLNPVDLSRIMVMLKMDFAALMGLTGAVFNKFFGSGTGILITFVTMILWVILPVLGFLRTSKRKDF